jgi:molybdopterin-containing oxidoreductase family iron-sulfur binding subunit
VTLGYGRGRAGKLGTGAGFNAYTLRTTASPWFASGLEMTRPAGKHQLAGTQHHFSIQGRHLVREGTLEEYAKSAAGADPSARPEFMGEVNPEHEKNSLYTSEWPSDNAGQGDGTKQHIGYNGQPIPAWAMVIDLTTCIGCGACTLACQAENNIPTVGKDQVVMNREMHWIRIDTYYRVSGHDAPKDTQEYDSFRALAREDLGVLTSNLETVFQPVPCMHCEKAPCEPVCPVSATSHSAEGINEMTYNRCIGTRYCTNNCPYKVRRFNYLQYSPQLSPTIALMKNPDVTVRSRGVMEKCTYCIQRITEARIEAEKEDRVIADGDVVTACQQVCPTSAILFGNLNDTQSNGGKGSRVRQLKMEPLNYALLTELNTRPRTSYLAKLRNPNPVLATGRRGEDTGAKADR